MDKRGTYCVLTAANGVLSQYKSGMKVTEEGLFDSDGKAVSRRHAMRLLKEAQYEGLTVSLERKTIHGEFFKQCQAEGWDTLGSHAWLLDGRVQARTEAMIMAAQDGVILTRAFRSRVMGKAVSPVCRVCRRAPETIGHILSCCPPLQWTMDKERHDKVLYQVVRTLAGKFGIVLPSDLQWGPARWKGVCVLEGKDVKLVIDVSVPTDRQLSATRPDLVVYSWRTKHIFILEVACAWEPLVHARQGERKEDEVPGVCEGSGDATPGMEGVGASPGGGGLGVIGWLQG